MRAYVTVPKIEISRSAWKHHEKAAIYVVSMTSDGRPDQPLPLFGDGLIGDVGSAFGRIFEHAEDRILVSSSFSGVAEDNYDGSPEGKSYPVANELASLVLRVTVTAS